MEKKIKFAMLSLDRENPRYLEIVQNEREGMLKMIENQKEKLLKLAKDIVKNGLNPSDLLMLIPDDKNQEKYIVVEGNRRFCTIMLLKKNSYLDGLKDKKLKSKWNKFIEDKNKSIQKTLKALEIINCTVFSTREEAAHWIKIKHARGHDGVGTEDWKPPEKDRYESRNGKSTAASLQILNFLKAECKDQKIITLISKDIKWSSTLNRLLNDINVREFLGIQPEKHGVFKGVFSKEEILKGLSKIVKDLDSKEINVNHLRLKKDRLDYINKFVENDIPNDTKVTPWLLDKSSIELNKKSNEKPSFVNEKSDESDEKPGLIDEQSRKTTRKRSNKNRKSVIPEKIELNIDEPRIRKVYIELQSLDVDKFPNAASLLTRQFIEFSVNFYLSKKEAEIDVNANANLCKKMQKLADYFKRTKVATEDQLKPIRTAISNKNSLLAPNTLNAYVHNINQNPLANDLRATWDNIEIFIEKIWK